MLEPLNRPVKGDLHVLGQRRTHALQIHFLRVRAARLNKELVARLFSKAHDLVLYTRAVARADALDHAAVQGRTVDVLQNHRLRLRVRPAHMTHRLVLGRGFRIKRKRRNRLVAVLYLQRRKVDRRAQNARRRPRLEAPQGNAEFFQRFRERRSREHTVRPARIGDVADENAPAKEGARREDHRLAGILCAKLGRQNPVVRRALQIDHLGLLHL